MSSRKLSDYVALLGLNNQEESVTKAVDIEAGKAGYQKYLADLEAAGAKKQKSQENETFLQKIGRYLGSRGAVDTSLSLEQGMNQAIEAYKNDTTHRHPSNDWTDEEKWAFGEKYAANADEAYAFAEKLNTTKAQEKKQKQQEALAKWTNRNAANRAVGSVASLGLNALLGGVGYLDALAQKSAGRDEISQHDVLLPHEISNTIQGAVSQHLNDKYGTINEDVWLLGGKGLGDAYGLGMSIGQSTLGAVTGGSAGTLVQFFGMAASNGVTDALSRGASADQAIAFGTIAGAAETLTEMVSVEKLVGIASAEGVQNVFKNVLKQAGQEAGEEFTTALISNIADNWIMGGKSQYYALVNQLVASGMSAEEAKKKAWIQIIEGIAYDTLSGALSGGISGAGATGLNRVNQQFFQKTANTQAKENLSPKTAELIEEGKKYESTKKRAEALEKKVAEGKELTGYELRMYGNQLSEAARTADVDSTRKAIVDKMKAEGIEEGKAKRLGEIALNKAIGNEISQVQEVMLRRNEGAMKVYNQISEKVMDSGYGDSQWAEETAIRRLRAENKALNEARQAEANSTSVQQLQEQKAKQQRLEALKRDVAEKYGTKNYKISTESLDKVLGENNGRIVYKTSKDSMLDVSELKTNLSAKDIIELGNIEAIANALGKKIKVYATTEQKYDERAFIDKSGEKITANGFFKTSTGEIGIDLRAGMNGEGVMLYTTSHELVHEIKRVSEETFDALEKLVTKALVSGGYSIETLIEDQKNKLIAEGKDPNSMGTEEFEARAREEMVADACMKFLASKNAIAEIKALQTENKGLWNALKKFFSKLFIRLNDRYKEVDPYSVEGLALADMRDNVVKPIRDIFFEGAKKIAEHNKAKVETKSEVKATVKKSSRNQGSTVSKITAEMTDAERYQELKNKKITAPYYNGEVNTLIVEELEGKINNEAKKAVVKIAEKLGILEKDINVKDLNVDIRISRSSLRESIDKKATPEQIAKLLPVFVPAVEQSILLERHNNRYYYDYETVYFDNLVGAYIEGDYVIPIRFGLKHSKTGASTLYIVIDQNKIVADQLTKIKKDIGHQAATPELSGESKSSLYVTYSLSQIAKFVNSKDLLRYLPDQMLNEEQHKAKWEAIAETIKKTNDKNDKKYAEYIAKGDERSAVQMVRAAAKAKGYTDRLYHGTKKFGFTEFDLSYSDDKISIFAAGSPELAQTYSGKSNTKKLSDKAKLDNLSIDEVVKRLNAESKESYEGQELQIEYEVMNIGDVNKLIGEVNDGVEWLQEIVKGKIKEINAKTDENFTDKDASAQQRLITLDAILQKYQYKHMSTPIYTLLHYTNAFDTVSERVADLEYKIRLMNKLSDADTSDGVVIKKDLGGYGVTVLSFDNAREELKTLVSSGNYALYGKPGRQLVIDAKGQNWNKINGWIQAAYRSTKDTYVKKDDSYYRLYDSNTNEQIFHGRIEINDNNKNLSIDTLHPIMVQKANNVLAIRSEYMKTTRDIARFAKDEGYDSVKFENLEDNGGAGKSVDAGDVYVYFDSNNLKSADTITYDDNGNVVPLSERFNSEKKDIRYSSRTRYSAGQMAAMKANLSHSKVYTKSSAMQLVNELAPKIRNRSFEALSDELWRGLNTFTSLDDKRTFASDMAEMFIDRMMVDTLVKNDEWDEAVEKMAYIKHGINSIKFRPEDLPDLEHILDKKGLTSLRGRWGYKSSSKSGVQRRPYGLDEFITDLSREMPGMSYLADMHPTEAMVEVDKLYQSLTEAVKQKYESAYEDMPDQFIGELKSIIEDEILKAYKELGEESKISKYLTEKLQKYDERISYWKAEKFKTDRVSHWNGVLATKALQIRDLKKGAFFNATQHKPDVFQNSIEELSKVQFRGNISPTGVRKVFAGLKQWYTMDNPMLYDRNNPDNESLYSDAIAMYIDILGDEANAEKPIAPEEYPMIYDVMNHLYVMMRNYNKIFRNGRWEEAPDLAKAYLNILNQNTAKRNALTRAQDLYNKTFLEPMAIAKQADNYNPNGFFTQTMEELRQAGINASIGEMNLRKKYDEFIDNNKNYLMNAAKDTVKYRGVDIPKLHLISLYMTMKRKHARAGLALNGFEFTVKNKWWDSADRVYIPGYLIGVENPTREMVDAATVTEMKTIEALLSDTDKQYIKVLEALYNEDLKNLKVERDMERQGYTNATLDYYYPIMRGAIAENIDTSKISDQNRATNSSFNKNTVKGSRQRLVIISADAMVNKHITDMCKYYYMSQAIENYNVLYNCDISENPNNPLNIATAVKDTKAWEKDFEYFRKIIKDMQGIRDPVNAIERAVESLRGNYAKFALGLNAKVLATQFSSMIAAGNVLGFGTLTSPKLLKISGKSVEKYCPIAAVRSYEKTALRAMALTDKIGKVSEMFSVGISKTDSFVIQRLFAACQLEAEKRGSGAVGTEENKIAAGKLLEQVIIETQQNSYATERSQAMRSNNAILKSLTMFTADGMKVISRIHEAVGEFKVAKQSGNKAEIKKAKKKLAKSVAVAACISVYLTGIAWVFNWLYDRDEEEDENKLLAFTLDTTGNFISALPIMSDLYDFIVNGYEVEDVTFDTLNNLFSAVGNIHKDVAYLINGNGDRSVEDINRDLRSLLYGVGQLTGIPFRNAYNLTRGIIGNFSSKAGYKIDSKFYKTSLASDLEEAIEAGDASKSSYIMSLIYDDRVGASVSEKQRREIIRLTKKEYSVLPKIVPDEIKRDGKTYTLTDAQKSTIVEEYSKVTAALDKLISSSFYASRSDKEKAYLIDYYHDKYYEVAVNKALKISDVKVYLYNAIGFSTYAKLDFVTKGIESDKDKNGNTVSGSKKTKFIEAVKKATTSEEKALLYIASKGYSLTDAEKQKLSKYLNSLNISASSKKKLAEMCGLNYKNGKITP